MKIVIVGGGAGGLELASKLGKKLGRSGKAEILLIDRNPTHIWKPLLHEVASGSLDEANDAVSYRAHAYHHGFLFKLGTFTGIDRVNKSIQLAAVTDNTGEEVLPVRNEHYDNLVLAIGSVSNDFSVPGVAEHCRFLDSSEQAVKFHDKLVSRFIHLNSKLAEGGEERLHIAIVGGGATGVELSAELFKAREWFTTYGLQYVTRKHIEVSLIEAGPRLLPALRESISDSVKEELEKMGVNVRLSMQVARAEAKTLITKDGERIEADIIVWAAGVKAPNLLAELSGLETNRNNQLLVGPTLQLKGDEAIFALGDCAGCLLSSHGEAPGWVPPRAQAAHQMASLVAGNLIRLLNGKPLREFKYKDYGSLVSLSDYSAFGRLMGGISSGSLSVEGRIARLTYESLYRMHQVAVHGWFRTVLFVLSDRINHFIRPRLKLH